MTLTLGQIADVLSAEGDIATDEIATGYSIDSRTASEGDLFFAVRGERFDGHAYVDSALKKGAVAAVVSQRWLIPAGVPETRLLRVPDTDGDCVLAALQSVAREALRFWRLVGQKLLIGITGSAGKTTTKECVAQVLSTKYKVLKTEGNLNNHFGLPLQLLRLSPDDEVAVLEMGMNHAGEIAALAHIAEPDWAVISNVAAVHTEFFEDGIEGVARAKRELIEALPETGLAFLNADDPRVAGFGSHRTHRTGTNHFFGFSPSADMRAVEVEELGLAGSQFLVQASKGGRLQQHSVQLNLLGRHNILNALAAISVGMAAGIPLQVCCDAMEQMLPTEKRGAVLESRGAHIINDAYNSNPHALHAMISTLIAAPARRHILVAGEMLELGPEGPYLHQECGRAAAQAGVDLIVGVRGLASELVQGAQAAGAHAIFFESPEAAAAWLSPQMQKGDLILLKASRGVQLERMLPLLDLAENPSPQPVSPQ